MKKILLALLLLLTTLSFSQNNYFENFDTFLNTNTKVFPSPFEIPSYYPICLPTYTATNYSLTQANYQGATGGNYLRLPNSKCMLINNINTLNITTLKFAIYKAIPLNSTISVDLIIEQSYDNGISYTPITYTKPTYNSWTLITANVINSEHLTIRFRNPNLPINDTYILIDDISLYNDSLSNINNNLIELKLYPNPTNSVLYLSTNNEKYIKIYDLIGNLVISKNITNFLDVSNLKNGIYVYEIIEGGNKSISKFIKI